LGPDAQWDALVAFTCKEIPWAGRREPLTPTTRILDDLRIDGDDALEFMEHFFETFDVTNAKSFPMQRYFGGEGTAGAALLLFPALLGLLVRFALRRPKSPDPDEHSLTLGMLLQAIRDGRWDTEAVERRQANA
jgi:hypothetical protein